MAIRPMVEAKDSNEPIRVWTPGCATGEEPYSVAMLILEELTRAEKNCPLNVFASDIDKHALQYAREGRYPKSIEADVSHERLRRFFTTKDGDDYFQVNKLLREAVVFADQDLIADPPFSKLDLLCCRNLLIYLKSEMQEKIVALFHFALRQKGVLFLGSAETIGRQGDLFETLHKRWRIFRRVGPTRHDRVDIPIADVVRRRDIEAHPPFPPRRETRLTHLAQQRLLDMLAPSAVLIDSAWRILYICGDVDAYVTHKPGMPTDDLLDKLRRGLRSKLRVAVHRALSEQRTVSITARVQRDGAYYPVGITVRVIHDREQEDLALVVFDEESTATRKPASSRDETQAAEDVRSPASRTGMDEGLDEHAVIRQLEEELAATKDDLQATVEQLESSNEEYKASNEEVMSINEELQSTNEELETSKEELQSLNEELSTVNAQLAAKVEELETKHADLQNLLAATDVATICLNTELAVRWFTPSSQQVIRLRDSDKGRPLADFSHDFADGDLVKIAERVLQKLMPVEDEAVCHDSRFYLRRVTPYRTEDHRIGGVVITFIDITDRKRAEEELKRLNETLEQQILQRTAMLKLLQDITRAANEAHTVDDAMYAALKRIAHSDGWQIGHVWRLAEGADDEMVNTGVWYVVEDAAPAIDDLDEFRRICQHHRFTPGQGMIGEVMESGEPKWVDDLAQYPEWQRGHARQLGMRAAAAFPVTVKGEVVAVMEFFARHPARRDELFTEIMPDVGIQLGHVIQRKQLEKQATEAAEAEQRRIGSDIHDGIGQELTGLRYMAQTHAETLAGQSSPEVKTAQRMTEWLESVQQQLRSILRKLVPVEIDEFGLVAALHGLAEQTTRAHDLPCSLECSQSIRIADTTLATHIYRIAQEAVQNAVRHAKASQIRMKLSEDAGLLKLQVDDDGRGIQPPSDPEAGFGLRSMAYRASLIGARFECRPNETGGTRVTCSVLRGSGG